MGCYINPEQESKERFLAREWTSLLGAPDWDEVPEGNLPVCLVDNGMFTAAGIAYSKRELEAFSIPFPKDPRPKNWFVVPVEKLKTVSDLDSYLSR